MDTHDKKATPPKEFMVWAMKQKQLVSYQSRMLLDMKIKELLDSGRISKEEYDAYQAVTKASIRGN